MNWKHWVFVGLLLSGLGGAMAQGKPVTVVLPDGSKVTTASEADGKAALVRFAQGPDGACILTADGQEVTRFTKKGDAISGTYRGQPVTYTVDEFITVNKTGQLPTCEDLERLHGVLFLEAKDYRTVRDTSRSDLPLAEEHDQLERWLSIVDDKIDAALKHLGPAKAAAATHLYHQLRAAEDEYQAPAGPPFAWYSDALQMLNGPAPVRSTDAIPDPLNDDSAPGIPSLPPPAAAKPVPAAPAVPASADPLADAEALLRTEIQARHTPPSGAPPQDDRAGQAFEQKLKAIQGGTRRDILQAQVDDSLASIKTYQGKIEIYAKDVPRVEASRVTNADFQHRLEAHQRLLVLLNRAH